MRIYLLLAMAVGASFVGSNCGGSGVGDPCVPEDEYLTTFSGFSVGEVNVESRSFQCLTRVCLVNHFQGRVSCPYGQSQETADLCKEASKCNLENDAPNHETSCRVPDRDGTDTVDRISVPVQPQLADRPADDAVYCSCRCDGPDAGARYCECPSGFACTELVDDLGIGKGQLAGSYCIKEDTEYEASKVTDKTCTSFSGDCGSLVERDSGALAGVNPPNPNILSDAEARAKTDTE